jgi:hypothetical protein
VPPNATSPEIPTYIARPISKILARARLRQRRWKPRFRGVGPAGVMRISVLLAGRLSGRIGNAIPAACIILNRQATKTCELRGMSSGRARWAGLFCRLACAAGNSKLSRRFPPSRDDRAGADRTIIRRRRRKPPRAMG